MLQRRTTTDGLVFYASPLLERAGVPHAFSTRLGGISPAPFDSLNLGNPNGCDIQDNYERVWENYRILQSAIGCAGRTLCRTHQVHGRDVACAASAETFDNSVKADAIVGRDKDKMLSVRIADCVPVLLASEDGRTVAAVHAGWRGVVAGVTLAAIEAMQRIDPSITPSQIIAAIGPCIGWENFEVGPEVLEEFTRAFGADAPIRKRVGEKGYVDLRAALRIQLERSGVPADRIDTSDRCTHRDRSEFFSHRRDNGVTGRMAAIISPAT